MPSQRYPVGMKFRIPHTVDWKMSKEKFAKDTGLREGTRGQACCNRLLGKRASVVHKQGACCPPGNDHPSIWNLDGKPEIFVFQPYGLDPDEVRELVKWCEGRGLECEIEACAWHNPHALLVQVQRKT